MLNGDEIEKLWELCRANPLEVNLPGHPPSVNKLYATFKGRRIKTRAGHNWESISLTYVRMASKKAYGTIFLDYLKGRPLKLEIRVYRPSWVAKSGSGLYVKPDLTNFFKSCEDGVMVALSLDDSAVIKFEGSKEIGEAEKTFVRLTFI